MQEALHPHCTWLGGGEGGREGVKRGTPVLARGQGREGHPCPGLGTPPLPLLTDRHLWKHKPHCTSSANGNKLLSNCFWRWLTNLPSNLRIEVNKRVLPHEPKRHTAHRQSKYSVWNPSANGRGYLHPVPMGGTPIQSWWGHPIRSQQEDTPIQSWHPVLPLLRLDGVTLPPPPVNRTVPSPFLLNSCSKNTVAE